MKVCEDCKEAPGKYATKDDPTPRCIKCFAKDMAKQIQIAAIDAGYPDAKTAIEDLLARQRAEEKSEAEKN